MKHFIFIITCLCFFAPKSIAQRLDPMLKVGIQSVEGASQTANILTSFDERYEGMKGNQYLNNEWLFGNLFGSNGQILRKEVPLKFDAFNNEIIMKLPNGDTVAVYPAICKMYYSYGQEILNLSQINGLKSKKGEDLSRKYVYTLFDGKNKLIKYIKKEIELADYKGAYSNNRPYDSFLTISEYFFVDEQGNFSPIKLSKKNLLKFMKSHESELNNFISENKLEISTEDGAISLLKHYDRLLLGN
jgi:hypothetical protein